jgi:hypothetical protein
VLTFNYNYDNYYRAIFQGHIPSHSGILGVAGKAGV